MALPSLTGGLTSDTACTSCLLACTHDQPADPHQSMTAVSYPLSMHVFLTRVSGITQADDCWSVDTATGLLLVHGTHAAGGALTTRALPLSVHEEWRCSEHVGSSHLRPNMPRNASAPVSTPAAASRTNAGRAMV